MSNIVNAKLPSPFRRQPLTKKDTHYGSAPKELLKNVSFGLSSMCGWRVTMEDAHVHNFPTKKRQDIAFCGVFDGHGGERAALWAASHVLSFIENSESFSFLRAEPEPEILARALLDGFFNCDETMKTLPEFREERDYSGSTAVVSFITPKHLIVGNTGDSRCCLVRKDQVVFASHDQKPSDTRETARVEMAKGSVQFGRINGDLASARSFGDFRYKKDASLPASQQQVTVMPDVSIMDRHPDDQVLILACDGIWDVMSNTECAHFVLAGLRLGASLPQICELVLTECLDKSSGDNMSVMVVALDSAPKEMSKSGNKRLTCAQVRELMYDSVL